MGRDLARWKHHHRSSRGPMRETERSLAHGASLPCRCSKAARCALPWSLGLPCPAPRLSTPRGPAPARTDAVRAGAGPLLFLHRCAPWLPTSAWWTRCAASFLISVVTCLLVPNRLERIASMRRALGLRACLGSAQGRGCGPSGRQAQVRQAGLSTQLI